MCTCSTCLFVCCLLIFCFNFWTGDKPTVKNMQKKTNNVWEEKYRIEKKTQTNEQPDTNQKPYKPLSVQK